jgi:hypothetical protein
VLGTALGVKERADLIARYIEETEELVDERLMDLPPAARHRVYLAREANGLETGLTGSINRDWARIHRLSGGLVYDSVYDESRLQDRLLPGASELSSAAR